MKKPLCLIIFILSFSITKAQDKKQDGSAGITIDLPLINNISFYNYHLDGKGENENKTGYLGSGFAFFYKKNLNKFSVGFENPSANKTLFAAKGNNQHLTINIFEATIHHAFLPQLSLIGGVNYSTYQYHLSMDVPPFTKVDKKDKTLGLTIGAEFHPANSLAVAATYRPSIYSLDKKAYRAVLSMGLRYDIAFWNKKK